jgi:phospholipase/carboxylesterase
MTNQFNFSNPNFPVKLPNDKKPQYLMVLLHGYGSNGDNLIGLSDIFDQIIPQTVYLSPNAPTATGFGGYQWFPISNLSNRELETGTISIAPYVHNFLDEALKFYNIQPENLIIAGFSQGSMLALHIGMERMVAPKAILAYSGALTAVADIEKRIQSKPPIMLCHGGSDDVVKPSYALQAYDILSKLGFYVEKHIFPNYPHTIPPEGLQASLKFLSTHIKTISS